MILTVIGMGDVLLKLRQFRLIGNPPPALNTSLGITGEVGLDLCKDPREFLRGVVSETLAKLLLAPRSRSGISSNSALAARRAARLFILRLPRGDGDCVRDQLSGESVLPTEGELNEGELNPLRRLAFLPEPADK